MMKRLLSTMTLLIFVSAYSQVIIGDAIGTVPVGEKTSVLLEFAAGQDKGLILPYVRTLPSGNGLTEGTLVLDASNSTASKIRYYNGVISPESPNGWVDLSNGNTSDISGPLLAQPDLNTIDSPEGKVIIGASSTTSDGVLVLESDDKAMVLPIVSDTDDVVDPAPGMIVYINKTGAKRLAVYNGEGWTFWKPGT